MSVAEEIREEQKKALSAMTAKEKLAYFWDYYKIHTLAVIALIAVTVSLIHQYVTHKDYGFYAAFINAALDPGQDPTQQWANEFQEYAQIDPKEYEVALDTSISLGDGLDPQYAMANQQKFLAMTQVGEINTVAADTKTFEQYAQFEYFRPLDDFMSEQELEKYRPYLYYTDAATFETNKEEEDYDSLAVMKDPSSLIIDHHDPSAMEQPVAVGIVLTRDNLVADAHLYAYLEDSHYDFQGYPSDVILGVPYTSEAPELAVRFLEYLQLGEN